MANKLDYSVCLRGLNFFAVLPKIVCAEVMRSSFCQKCFLISFHNQFKQKRDRWKASNLQSVRTLTIDKEFSVYEGLKKCLRKTKAKIEISDNKNKYLYLYPYLHLYLYINIFI